MQFDKKKNSRNIFLILDFLILEKYISLSNTIKTPESGVIVGYYRDFKLFLKTHL